MSQNILLLKDIIYDEINDINTIIIDPIENNKDIDIDLQPELIYDKIPTKFIDINEWPKYLNIKCWNCDLFMHSIPIFIPTYIETNGVMDVYGIYCSFTCAHSYINNNIDITNKNNLYINLIHLKKCFDKKYINNFIELSPNKNLRIEYGGTLTIDEYKTKIIKMNKK